MLNKFSSYRHKNRGVLFPKAHFGLHAMLTSAGYEKQSKPTYDYNGLHRGKVEFTTIQYTLSGKGMLEFEGQKMQVLPGQAMLLYFPHNNRYWLEKGDNWEFFYICLNGSEVMRVWRTVIGKMGPLLKMSEECPTLHKAVEICMEILNGKVNSPWQASELAYQLSMKMMEFAIPSAPGLERSRPFAVEQAIKLCSENYADSIGINDMARAAGLSRFHFSRLFHESEGMPPGEFLRRYRLNQAVRLLQTTHQSVRSVAETCGFVDASHFCKSFKKTYGVSPGVFKESSMY